MAMAMAIIQCQAHPPQTRRVKIGRERQKPGICAIRSRPILLFRFCFHRPPFWLSKKFCSLSLSCWQRWRSLLVWTYPLWRESNTSSLRNFQLAGISSLILLANQLHDQMKRSWITTSSWSLLAVTFILAITTTTPCLAQKNGAAAE